MLHVYSNVYFDVDFAMFFKCLWQWCSCYYFYIWCLYYFLIYFFDFCTYQFCHFHVQCPLSGKFCVRFAFIFPNLYYHPCLKWHFTHFSILQKLLYFLLTSVFALDGLVLFRLDIAICCSREGIIHDLIRFWLESRY